ncbi:SGNH/GDSL hydrolase family protein [Occultella kanbiaonis]|uniref:SGNH/GDSL hydrolase family protein n=1 Tax=Occultella kanbiaonis TaxID=2675754 RepID=UPI0025B6E4DE|nr:SGNH/GDSL hydrolase family protein [Occultella kanbiaonis]
MNPVLHPVSDPARWSRYVACGDSMTEGLWDPDPDNPAQVRGWADQLAGSLSARRVDAGLAPLEYANLAIRGRLLEPIIAEQLPVALDAEPDLISLVGGGNDLLRPGSDPDRMAAILEDAVHTIRRAGVDVLLATGTDTRQAGVLRAIRGRVATFNAHIWSIARRHDAYVVDVWGLRAIQDWRMWAQDRIHLTTDGHQRVAQAALVALGLTPDDAAWADPLARLAPVPTGQRFRSDAEWFVRDVYPWATRRLRGRSSGDARVPKRPRVAPLPPATSAATPSDAVSEQVPPPEAPGPSDTTVPR